jgi:hypothetical protein
MPWSRLDDQFTDHPKIVEAGPMAGWLYVCGLTYSTRYLTDGFIPRAQVKRLADLPDCDDLAGRLVHVGLWEAVEGGYRIHDYLDYNRSSADVRAERDETARRQAEWRARKAAKQAEEQESNAVSNGVTGAVSNGKRLPAPLTSRPRSPAEVTTSPEPGSGAGAREAPAAVAAPPVESEEKASSVRAAPKPTRSEPKYAAFLNAVKSQAKARGLDVLIRGSPEDNAMAVNISPYSAEQLATACVAFESGEWQDQFLVTRGAQVYVLVEAAAAYLDRSKFGSGNGPASVPTRRRGVQRVEL